MMTGPEIRDKIRPPEGVLKHAKFGIATVLVLLVVFALIMGNTKQQAAAPTARERTSDRIAGNREVTSAWPAAIRNESERMEQQAFAVPPPSREEIQQEFEQQRGFGYDRYSPGYGYGYDRQEQKVDPIEAKRKALEVQRLEDEYKAQAAPSLVLSYREEPDPEEPERVEPRTESKEAAVVEPPAKPGLNLQQADGKRYVIFRGTALDTILRTQINAEFSGPIVTEIQHDVYSHDGQRKLIPRGSKILGSVEAVNSVGQERVALVFDRVIMPDGYSVDIEQFPGLSQAGETGVRDKVNHHYMRLFLSTFAVAAVSGAMMANTRGGWNTEGIDMYRQGVATSLSRDALRIFNRFSVLPTHTIRAGQRLKVILTKDIAVHDYAKHEMPSNL